MVHFTKWSACCWVQIVLNACSLQLSCFFSSQNMHGGRGEVCVNPCDTWSHGNVFRDGLPSLCFLLILNYKLFHVYFTWFYYYRWSTRRETPRRWGAPHAVISRCLQSQVPSKLGNRPAGLAREVGGAKGGAGCSLSSGSPYPFLPT